MIYFRLIKVIWPSAGPILHFHNAGGGTQSDVQRSPVSASGPWMDGCTIWAGCPNNYTKLRQCSTPRPLLPCYENIFVCWCPLSFPVLLLLLLSWFVLPEAMAMTWLLCYITNFLLCSFFLLCCNLSQWIPTDHCAKYIWNHLANPTHLVSRSCLLSLRFLYNISDTLFWVFIIYQGWHVYHCLVSIRLNYCSCAKNKDLQNYCDRNVTFAHFIVLTDKKQWLFCYHARQKGF